MYQVKILFYGVDNPTLTEEESNFENEFDTFEDAYAMAYNEAVDLCDYLNKDSDIGFESQISFGLVDFEDEIHVYDYCLDDEFEPTRNTELVATYLVEEL